MDSPFATFCISTRRRPDFLSKQLLSLLKQTLPSFEVVICDNDPARSGATVVTAINDSRLRYHANGNDLGMIASFNRALSLARGEFIVFVTDDDPVETGMLTDLQALTVSHPGYSLYGGLKRLTQQQQEVIPAGEFISELLDPKRTASITWSGCLVRRTAALEVGGIPDYGSPHLADHAFLALAGSRAGAVIVNRLYSSLSAHEGNFSKGDVTAYYTGCIGFHALFDTPEHRVHLPAVNRHLGKWIMGTLIPMRSYYTRHVPDPEKVRTIRETARKILDQPFMRPYALEFRIKDTFKALKSGVASFRKK